MQDNHSDCSGVAQHACLKQDTLAALYQALDFVLKRADGDIGRFENKGWSH